MTQMRTSPEFNKLSSDQRQSLDWTRSISIRANAGSGKTSVLIQRIVQILNHAFQTDEDLKLDHVVAITFTRKAAAEMRERLRKDLEQCLKDSQGAEKAFWQARLDELPTCPIGTIDALCHRILRGAVANGLIDDLDPSFGILDELDRMELLDRALERTEQQIDTDPEARQAWANWLTTQGRWELNKALGMLLKSPLSPDSCARALEASGSRTDEQIVELLSLPGFNETLAQFRANWPKACEQIDLAIAELQQVRADGDKTKTVVTVIENLKALRAERRARPTNLITQMRGALLTGAGTPHKRGLGTDDQPKSPAFAALAQGWQPHLADWNFTEPELDGRNLARELIKIYEHAYRHFRALCREENRYDFNYLAEQTI